MDAARPARLAPAQLAQLAKGALRRLAMSQIEPTPAKMRGPTPKNLASPCRPSARCRHACGRSSNAWWPAPPTMWRCVPSFPAP